jgi:hypothetical protein|tara:strand:+ start:2515 stop:3516 length:1002 start_codon:yes stop_codon:yes gene_type:complete
MTLIIRIWIIALAVALIFFAVNEVASATDNFARVKLPKGISIEIPKNWVVLSGNQRITLDSAVESGLDLSGIEQESSELPFAANYYDDKGNTLGIMNVRYYPQLELTQADAQSANAQDVRELDAALKENGIPSMKAFNMTVTSWAGTQKSVINGITVFLTEYQRKSLKGSGEFRVRLVRVLAADKSFTVTVSYHKAASFLLKPITDRIINSLSLEGIKKVGDTESVSKNGTSQEGSVMADLYGEQWGLVLFLSFLFTWGVGLAPPLLIRFAIMRRPIGKGWSLGVVALFWVFNLVLFIAFGSQSKSHSALALVAFASYAILRKGAKKQVGLYK